MSEVLTFEERDPARPAQEARLATLPEAELLALYDRTKAAAALARQAGDMPLLYRLVRGTKTLQRIAGQRGILIRAARGAARTA